MSKPRHLSYLGDAEIGSHTNIGAGTITCNYDGYTKSKTRIGDHVHIGANTTFIAPISVHNHSLIGAGTVVTEDIPENTLALSPRPSNP